MTPSSPLTSTQQKLRDAAINMQFAEGECNKCIDASFDSICVRLFWLMWQGISCLRCVKSMGNKKAQTKWPSSEQNCRCVLRALLCVLPWQPVTHDWADWCVVAGVADGGDTA